MFDIGFSELFLVAVVALIVLGPERLPRAARFAGLWVRRARAQWYSVKAELENELADEELRRSLRQAHADLDDARAAVVASGEAVRDGFGTGARD
ncbi:Sec-independent protein translocase protein TatB, partial [Lysobacter sp. A3-1-A15]